MGDEQKYSVEEIEKKVTELRKSLVDKNYAVLEKMTRECLSKMPKEDKDEINSLKFAYNNLNAFLKDMKKGSGSKSDDIIEGLYELIKKAKPHVGEIKQKITD